VGQDGPFGPAFALRLAFQPVAPSNVVPWREALQEFDGRVRVQVEVKPGASRTNFPDGFSQWRGRIGVAVQAPAQDGKANVAVCAASAKFLGVAKSQVTVTAGGSDCRKTLELAGLVQDSLETLLAATLEAGA
jgi:uncharacterized protein (TIGR00251 family)